MLSNRFCERRLYALPLQRAWASSDELAILCVSNLHFGYGTLPMCALWPLDLGLQLFHISALDLGVLLKCASRILADVYDIGSDPGDDLPGDAGSRDPESNCQGSRENLSHCVTCTVQRFSEDSVGQATETFTSSKACRTQTMPQKVHQRAQEASTVRSL